MPRSSIVHSPFPTVHFGTRVTKLALYTVRDNDSSAILETFWLRHGRPQTIAQSGVRTRVDTNEMQYKHNKIHLKWKRRVRNKTKKSIYFFSWPNTKIIFTIFRQTFRPVKISVAAHFGVSYENCLFIIGKGSEKLLTKWFFSQLVQPNSRNIFPSYFWIQESKFIP